jgi:hypothetical protein
MLARPSSISTIKPLETTQKTQENNSNTESQKEIKEAFLTSVTPAFSPSYRKKRLSKKIFKSFLSPSASVAAKDHSQPPLKSSLYSPPNPLPTTPAIPKASLLINKASGSLGEPVMTPLKVVISTQHSTENKGTTCSLAEGPTIPSMEAKATTHCTQAQGKTSSEVTKAMTFWKDNTATTPSKVIQAMTLSAVDLATTP